MPTYVYKFIDTDETIEVQQSFTDATLTEAVHPDTGETMAVKKVFQPVGVTFKGDGFYKTDSRKTGAKRSGSSGSDSSSGSDGSKSSDTSTSSDAASTSKSTSSDAASTSKSSNGSGTSAGSSTKGGD